jgi:hypothetical protein
MEKSSSFRRRKRSQGGTEVVEFLIFFWLTFPALLWMFVTGMDFVYMDKVNDVALAADLMVVKNLDLTLQGTQQIVARVATGLNLVTGTGPNGNGAGGGNGLLVISTVQYIGATTCSGCTNVGKYVFTRRIYIGNKSLQVNGSSVDSLFGDPAAGLWDSSVTGNVSNNQSNTGAQTNAAFAAMYNGTPIPDGQVVYVVESFFKPPFSFGGYAGSTNGVYVRALM